MYLYLDTSNFLVIGLYHPEEKKWVRYEELPEEKQSSKVLHFQVYQILKEEGINLKEGISGVITSAGPGSYTGLRMSEGVAQILDWNELPCFSFYHYEIPFLVEKKEGVFISEAFKGEYFYFRWDGSGEEVTRGLTSKENILSVLKENEQIFSSYPFSKEDNDLVGLKFTFQELKDNPKAVFEFVLNRAEHLPIYYYRKIEEEFKKSRA